MMKHDSSVDKYFDDLTQSENSAFNKILEDLYHISSMDFRQYRHRCLRRRIEARMHDNQVKKFVDYLQVLKKKPDEYGRLLDAITINVTNFFRNPETFEAIRRKVIPAIINQKKKQEHRVLRIWSAGCASGEEPYSIAIMLKSFFKKELDNLTVNIIGTDIDEAVLDKAMAGKYCRNALNDLNGYQINEFFMKDCEDTYVIKPEFMAMVKFKQHNMISDIPPAKIDLVLCRNVVIYFSKALQKRVYKNFYDALTQNGYLVIGKVETLFSIADDLFHQIDLTEKIFQKKHI